MKALHLDFQARSAQSHLAGFVLLALAICAAAIQVQHYIRTQQEIEAIQDEIYKLEKRLEKLATISAATPSGTSTALAEQRALAFGKAHWNELFASLEAAISDDITLLSLRPGEDGLSLSGEGKNLEAVSTYLQRLQTQGHLRHPYLANYEVIADHPQHPVRFTINEGQSVSQ